MIRLGDGNVNIRVPNVSRSIVQRNDEIHT